MKNIKNNVASIKNLLPGLTICKEKRLLVIRKVAGRIFYGNALFGAVIHHSPRTLNKLLKVTQVYSDQATTLPGRETAASTSS